MTDHKYTALQLRRAANISRVTYDQWRARRFIKSDYKAGGSGKPQLFNFREVLQAAVLARLVSVGISVSAAAAHVSNLYGFKNDKAYLVVWGDNLNVPRLDYDAEHNVPVVEILREADLFSALKKHEGAAIVSLDAVETRVKKSLNV